MFSKIRTMWGGFSERHPELSKFLMFFILSNGVTVLQIVVMPVFKALFARTTLIDTNFQVWPVGTNLDGSQYYIFDYAAGALPNGGGGLAYFLAVQLAILIAQVINFFAQRNITFKSNSSVWRAFGSFETMRRIGTMKPRSSMWSASSSTTTSVASRRRRRCSM